MRYIFKGMIYLLYLFCRELNDYDIIDHYFHINQFCCYLQLFYMSSTKFKISYVAKNECLFSA